MGCYPFPLSCQSDIDTFREYIKGTLIEITNGKTTEQINKTIETLKTLKDTNGNIVVESGSSYGVLLSVVCRELEAFL